jgi:hypothetical protein
LVTSAAEVAEDAQGLVRLMGCAWVIFCSSSRDPEVEEGVCLPEPVTEIDAALRKSPSVLAGVPHLVDS